MVSDALIYSSYACTAIAFIYVIFVITQLCVSPAYGRELKLVKYRIYNTMLSIFVFLESICSILHFQDTEKPIFAAGFVLFRGIAVTTIHGAATIFIIHIFDTLWQSRLSKNGSPIWFKRIFQIAAIFHTSFTVFCVGYALITQENLTVKIWNLFVLGMYINKLL